MGALDRRTFLIGAGIAGAGGLLAACGGDDSTAGSTTTRGPAPTSSTLTPLTVPLLIPSFPDGFRAPSPFVHSVEQRVAYALHDGNDVMRANAPDSVQLEVFHSDEQVGGGIVTRRDVGVPTPYFSITFTPPEAGTYRSVLTVDGETSEHEFNVLEPGETSIPQPGDRLPSIGTATVEDPMGVDPLCTRLEQCPFHTTNLVDALAAGDKATVLSIATPGFCQTAICGPVIDLLIEAAAGRDDLHVVHAEVYLHPNDDEGLASGAGGATTPIVDAFLLPYEPVLFVCDSSGVVLRRLDAIYDGSELAEALALV